MKSLRTTTALVTAVLLIASTNACKAGPNLADGLYAKIDTVKGAITIRLEYQKAPLAVANFVGLAEGTLDAASGRHFYDGLTFHRVEPGFVIQGGDPAGDGSGDPGYNFPDEFSPELRHDTAGIVAMANYGPDTNGSQFYIALAPLPALDDTYTVFGKVIDGMPVVQKLAVGDVMTTVSIIRVGADAKQFKSDQAAWNTYYAAAATASKVRLTSARKKVVDAIMTRWPGLQARPDGILTSMLTEGTGQKIRRGSIAKVSYKGMLPDGRVFDQSILHGGPFEFELGMGKVIPGWDMIILDMKKGEKRLVAIPPEYAYGTQGAAGIIPPNSYLIFELELVDFTL
ncbi:MAG TPA: peptidylprolyl isomerase [bacterium]|nr:peptidylprolyl isomerase [bacterium]